MNIIPATDLAYCAGVIDGEGCIGIHPRSQRQTFRVHIAVAMCERGAIELLHATFGGHVGITKHLNRPQHRDQYVWAVAAKKAALCLELILPYLRVKQVQARNALRLQEINSAIRDNTTAQRKLRKGFGPANRGQFVIDPALRAEAEQLYAANRALNKRGLEKAA